MDFDLSKEHAAIQSEARRFAVREIIPRIKEEKFKRDLVATMGEIGFFGCAFPMKYGGTEMGFLGHSIVCEEISRADSGLRSLFNLQGMTVPYTIMEWGTDAAKEKYIEDLVLAKTLGCTCFSEPNAGSDLASIETTIEDKGDYYILNGTKTWISNGTIANTAIVYATFDPDLKHRGLSAVVVDTDQPGWKARETEKLGDKSSPIAEIHLDNIRVPKENLLGEWGQGFTIAMMALDRGRISVGSGAVGLSQACLDASVEYANQRKQFGKFISEYQLIKGTIAEMVSLTEASRLMVRRGAWLNDQDRPFTREIATAKYFAGEAVVKVAGLTMEVFGGMGYSLDAPAERFYRDSKLYQVGEGTANIMRILIANDALGSKKANRPRLKVPSQFLDLT
ncbi:MAG: acyl-CoA dehydrogenase [Deltaproteobacteria bacterium]|jgi:glutaryl-CoA dehydrogenase (non-decarboxylating)|nr:acyl-CoA dehydrogenase [Deltaproteobacteria bacterium]MBT4266327.1 acyl-CoA dehydrogenase [Deltaproteobacteria bacterium]MBT4642171.1 acyl-CoA dehydrogenase [Deltaproteobacteria bacterium]MBT6500389.1 acyl-CoA dehydrogenase [Deltaproteobacteria bacterium]MBT7152164.1 acyl-CoA dehydrogenase [Deltaproteobacteria bacterium]